MGTRGRSGVLLGAPSPPPERLYRVPEPTYRGLVAAGLLPPGVSRADGLLVEGGDPARLHRMSLDAYEGIVGRGLLDPGVRVELLDGLLVRTMTRGLPHFVATLLILRALERAVPAGWFVAKEDPIALPSGPSGSPSMPEPDVSVIRGSVRDYLARRPGPADVGLVVEVSDTTLREDRLKLSRYAWEGVPSAWVVDLESGLVEVHEAPSGPSEAPGYGAVARYGRGESIPLRLDGREAGLVPVDDLLP